MKYRFDYRFLIIPFLLIGAIAAAARATALTDISGTWQFSVDLDNGGHGDPTFVFKQEGEKLTGSYDGPLGQYAVTGTVKDDKAVFGFEFTNQDGQKGKTIYTGTIQSPGKMSGTMEIVGGPKGKWTAARK